LKKSFKYFFILFFIYSISLQANETTINVNTLINKAKLENKHLLVFFHMTHCGYCKRMENRTFENQKVQELLKKHFIYLDINIDYNTEIFFNKKRYLEKSFAESVDVDFYPTVLFFDENYDVIYTSRGYRDSNKFEKILHFIKTKSYEKIDFFDYKKGKEKEE